MSDPASKAYLANRVNPILEKLVIDLVVKRPDNITSYMINWLKEKGEVIEKAHLDNGTTGYHVDSDEGSDSEQGEDLIDVKTLQQMRAQKEMRTSVSAEAYGQFNQKASFKPKVVAKTHQSEERIRNRLTESFMFRVLEDSEKKVIIDAMEEKKFRAGDVVIKQGDDGDCLYLVDSGELKCERRFQKDAEPKFLKNYQPSEAFGELALLYNAPRAATITATKDSVTFSLDRETFNHIVKDAAAKKRERYEKFLAQVDILADMEPYERLQIADALKSDKFKKGDYIVKEGEVGDIFFILEEGEAKAYKNTKGNANELQEVYKYKPGQYFGEIALLKNTTRAASIIATTDVVVVSMDRNSFKRLLGPLDEILRRNFNKYEKYMG